MKQYNILILFAFLVSIFLYSCDSKSEDEAAFLIAGKNELVQTFTSASQTKEISVYANRIINAQIIPDEAAKWCSFNIIPGNLNETTLEIAVKENEVKGKRQAVISLVVDDYRPLKVDIIQSGIILPLEITDFEPKLGGKSDIVTLSGNNFGDMANNVTVLFNNTEAQIVSIEEKEIKIAVPQMSEEGDCQIKIQKDGMEEIFAANFNYEKRWWVDNVILDVLPSAIAVDDKGENILYLRRFEDARLGGELGIYRVDTKTMQHTFIVGYGLVAGNYGYTGITYDKKTMKFYAIGENGGTKMHIVSIDPANNWNVKDNPVEAGVNGYWAPGLTSGGDGKLYSRQWNGAVIQVDPQSWTATTVASLIPHGGADQSPALALATGTNNLYIQIRSSSELAYIDVTNGNITWLNTSTETGFYDGLISGARFLRGEQMCSDKDGNIFLVDQDNHAIRMITNEKVVTCIGGNGAGAENGMGQKAKLTAPSGLCIDSQGVLYIGDTWNASIRKAVLQ